MQEGQAILPLGSIVRERYVIEDWLGKGGFGAVYLVRDLRVKHNLYALKEVINPDRKERNRFLFEAELLKRFDHHALAKVYWVFDDETQNRAYMLMDYIEGPNLETLRQRQPDKRFSFPQVLPIEPAHTVPQTASAQGRSPVSLSSSVAGSHFNVLSIMAPIMEAVDYLHSQQPPVLHRDIKPSNIIVPETGDGAVLVDFGVAKEYNPDSTTTAVRHCSPGYAAPEQYGKGSSTRTDIYELGATFYTLLTGKIPADALHRMIQVGDGGEDPLEPINKLVPAVPHHVARAIHRAMSLKSNERFSTVEQFWQALNARPTWRRLTVPAIVPLSAPAPVVPDPAFATSSQSPVAPAAVSVHTHPRFSHFNKLVLLLLFLIAILVGFGLETGLWSYIIRLRANHPIAIISTPRSVVAPTLSPTVVPNIVSPTTRPTRAPMPRPTAPPVVVPTRQPTVVSTPHPKSTPTPIPTPIPYPNIVGSYNGSIDDTTENVTTSMALSIQQKSGQGSISGNFTVGPALLGSGPFSGSVTTAQYIQFIVQSYQGNAPLFFYGQVHADASLSGNYCSINTQNQCDARAGDAGTWNVTRASADKSAMGAINRPLLSSGGNSLQDAYDSWPNAASIAVWCGIVFFFSLCLLMLMLYCIRVFRFRFRQRKMKLVN